jgi:hypothetical protein
VVRELGAKRIWFAQALLSSAAEEVRVLVAKAKSWAEQLGKPVQLWMSDKQDAFVKAIATEFPEVPHRYCQNHFLRDVAKPMLEQDSHAKVKMRNKVRGLRAIERDVLAERRTPEPRAAPPTASAAAEPGRAEADAASVPALPPLPDDVGDVVLDYCACVRGILNDGQGGPLHPPGLRMAGALGEVRESLQKNLDAKKGGARRSN